MNALNPGKTYRTCRDRASGFTLLEVLIALVVLSIGLLGIAALQGVGLRSSQGAYLTSQASLLAYDMADRIRANPQTLAVYNGFVANDANCLAAGAGLAGADLQEWSCAVRALLPDGTGRIDGVQVQDFGIIGTITRYTITLTWRDLQDGGTPWEYVLAIEI
jgi:type IV pilus assembly protein PilV